MGSPHVWDVETIVGFYRRLWFSHALRQPLFNIVFVV